MRKHRPLLLLRIQMSGPPGARRLKRNLLCRIGAMSRNTLRRPLMVAFKALTRHALCVRGYVSKRCVWPVWPVLRVVSSVGWSRMRCL